MLPVGRPWHRHLAEVLGAARQSVVVSAPYVSAYGTEFLMQHTEPLVRSSGAITLVTDLSPANVAQGATEASAILELFRACTSFRLIHLAHLHAKVYVADDSEAIVSSGNLTRGGLVSNFEYSVHLSGTEEVGQVRQDVLDY
ncbi:MAG TPA: phospholipase D-like domain-containing protein, partial [Rhodothermales bacterium]|nr:phospholipase D-like domain-containing protein [Rhodothermales bacterium]